MRSSCSGKAGEARHDGKVLAVIGASEFQVPLIRKAQTLGCTVHAFAWQCGDLGESVADVFHPVSTAERDEVLRICREVGVDGVCTIGSDFNNITATWVANRMGLSANTDECVRLSTDKQAMRKAFMMAGDPSPKCVPVREEMPLSKSLDELTYPVIVKPSDRSGSRGITKLSSPDGLMDALAFAWEESFSKTALVEEFLEGDEFSVECMSWEGSHHVLQITRKFTTGAPHFIETAHLEPALLSAEECASVEQVVMHALDTLGVQQGASHAELKINGRGEPWIVEIGSRMGGDYIGSDLVPLSTGIDFVGAVVDVALGVRPDLRGFSSPRASAVRFVLTEEDVSALANLQSKYPDLVMHKSWNAPEGHEVVDSSTRFGHCIMAADSVEELLPWLCGGGARD
ncbi:MAG: ATP-grasp domain-containing protein [Atopobiaceae bacterium]|nr:ATP-grasp domain-containing protein [Atopobiaceae bacterium]